MAIAPKPFFAPICVMIKKGLEAMQVLDIFLVFFSFLEAIIGIALTAASTMRFREPVKKRVLTGLIVMLWGIILLSGALIIWGIHAVDSLAIIIILVMTLLWFLICSDDTFFVTTFNFLTCINIYVAISYISSSLGIRESGVAYLLIYNAARTVLYVVILLLLFKFVRPRFRRLVDALDKEWRAATLVPFIFLILQVFLLYYPIPYWYWEGSNWNQIIIIIVYVLFLAVYYLLYIQASGIVEKYALENRHLLIVQQDKLWESELERQKAAVSLASQQRHDMHHHNAVITDMLKDGNLDELEAYMQSINAALDMSESTVYCKNPIVNSICNAYVKKAEQAKIKIQFHVIVPEQTSIDNVDLTCILSNTLENAIEGCLRLPDGHAREIIVTAKYMDARLRIQVENSCRDDIVFEGELPKTQKKIGGTGIQSIVYTAERYDGTSGFSVSSGRFITQIVLNER